MIAEKWRILKHKCQILEWSTNYGADRQNIEHICLVKSRITYSSKPLYALHIHLLSRLRLRWGSLGSGCRLFPQPWSGSRVHVIAGLCAFVCSFLYLSGHRRMQLSQSQIIKLRADAAVLWAAFNEGSSVITPLARGERRRCKRRRVRVQWNTVRPEK